MKREDYISKICELVERCNDLSMLDLIWRLLCKSI